jgi:hypothetical protein
MKSLKNVRFGCRLREKRKPKSAVYIDVNEHFSLSFFTQDVPKMAFSRTEGN